MAKQLSIKWKTDAGPRIRCMRDYPPEPQVLVLEQANLPPKSRSTNASSRSFSHFSSKVPNPFSLCKETTAGRSSLARSGASNTDSNNLREHPYIWANTNMDETTIHNGFSYRDSFAFFSMPLFSTILVDYGGNVVKILNKDPHNESG